MKKWRVYFFLTLVFISGVVSSNLSWASKPSILFIPWHILTSPSDRNWGLKIEEAFKKDLEKQGVVLFSPEQLNITPSSLENSLLEKEKVCKDNSLDQIVEGTLTKIGGALELDLNVFLCNENQGKKFYLSEDLISWSSLAKEASNKILSFLWRPQKVYKVQIKGNVRMDEDAILQVVALSPGDFLDEDVIQEDIKRIYSLGYFEDVKADLKQTDKGYIITYIVKERPLIKKIIYQGNKAVKSKDLEKICPIKVPSILNFKEIKRMEDQIKIIYKEKGYQDTQVTTKIEKISSQAVKVVFNIKEGKKIYIKKIEFVGNKAFSDEKLKSLLEIKEKDSLNWWDRLKNFFSGRHLEPGVYSETVLYRDLGKVLSFYHNHGYIDARVGEPDIEKKGNEIYIRIPIKEGPQYKVGDIQIRQDLFLSQNFLLRSLSLPKDKVFKQEDLRRDVINLTKIFADKGYAYAQVKPLIKRDLKQKKIDVIFQIDKGPLVYINRIEIQGNTKTKDKVIRRELLFVEQRPFSATRFQKSQERLNRLGFFKEVRFSTEKGVAPNLMDVKIKVKEDLTGMFSVGAGYSSVDHFMMMAEISQRNLFGNGQTLSFQGYFSSQSTKYTLSFYEPYFRDTRVSLKLSLYDWTREYQDYTRDSQGGSIKFGYSLTPNTKLTTGYKYDDSNITNYSDNASYIILASKDIHVTSAIEIGVTRDTRNHFFLPTKGTRTSLNFTHAGGVLGGDSAFEKITLDHSMYHPLISKLVGHFRLGLGYITEGAGGNLPIYEKFYLGGINSIRGYSYGDISPIDPATGERIGGTIMGFSQFEILFPLLKDVGLHGVVFYDIGDVWKNGEDLKDFDWKYIRQSIGMGLRWLSPLGPIRIEWGYNINAQEGEDNSNWNFMIGGVF